jgi:predicted DNA-binding protein (UPF0278 family)
MSSGVLKRFIRSHMTYPWMRSSRKAASYIAKSRVKANVEVLPPVVRRVSSVVTTHAGAKELRVGAEIWIPARRPDCQPAPAFFFMKAVATFGARLDESEAAIDVKRRA